MDEAFMVIYYTIAIFMSTNHRHMDDEALTHTATPPGHKSPHQILRIGNDRDGGWRACYRQ